MTIDNWMRSPRVKDEDRDDRSISWWAGIGADRGEEPVFCHRHSDKMIAGYKAHIEKAKSFIRNYSG